LLGDRLVSPRKRAERSAETDRGRQSASEAHIPSGTAPAD
jgi:hypothetical protein